MSQWIEEKIVKKLIKSLSEHGTPVVSVWDGEIDTKVSTKEEILALVFDLDQCHLYTKGGSWVFLVLGNEWDVVSDYTMDLEESVKPIYEWIERNER